jgi:hypothetical protein
MYVMRKCLEPRLRAATAIVFALCVMLTTPASAILLTGRVLEGRTGRPIRDTRLSTDSLNTTLSDSVGRYVLDAPAHDHYVEVEASGMYTLWKAVPPCGDSAICNFSLLDWFSPTIEGQVTDVPGGKPQSGVKLSISENDAFVFTDALGHFIIPLFSPGTYVIRARQPLGSGQGAAETDIVAINVDAGSHRQLDLSLNLRAHGSGYGFTKLPAPLLAWPNRRDPWNAGRSEFILDAGYIRKVGGLDRALGQVPGVVVR